MKQLHQWAFRALRTVNFRSSLMMLWQELELSAREIYLLEPQDSRRQSVKRMKVVVAGSCGSFRGDARTASMNSDDAQRVGPPDSGNSRRRRCARRCSRRTETAGWISPQRWPRRGNLESRPLHGPDRSAYL